MWIKLVMNHTQDIINTINLVWKQSDPSYNDETSPALTIGQAMCLQMVKCIHQRKFKIWLSWTKKIKSEGMYRIINAFFCFRLSSNLE